MVQSWYEDDIDEGIIGYEQEVQIDDGQEVQIDAVHEMQTDTGHEGQEEKLFIDKVKSRKRGLVVSFADKVTVRPIPATGKCRRTPIRGGSGKLSTRWQSRPIDDIAPRRFDDPAAAQEEHGCANLMRRGDGRRWGDENFEAPGSVRTSSWRSLQPSTFHGDRIGHDDRINSIESGQEEFIRLRPGSERPSERPPQLGNNNRRSSRFGWTWSSSGSLEQRNSTAAPSDLVQLESTALETSSVEGGAFGGGQKRQRVSRRRHLHAWARSMHVHARKIDSHSRAGHAMCEDGRRATFSLLHVGSSR
jgi:hypothetical protein